MTTNEHDNIPNYPNHGHTEGTRTMNTNEHDARIEDRGHGFPDVGAYVTGSYGDLYRVVSIVTTIHSGADGRPNYVHATLEPVDWADLCEYEDVFSAMAIIDGGRYIDGDAWVCPCCATPARVIPIDDPATIGDDAVCARCEAQIRATVPTDETPPPVLSRYTLGKFTFNVDAVAHSASLDGCAETLGSVDEYGEHFAKVEGPFTESDWAEVDDLTADDRRFLRAQVGAIVREDSQGFVSVDWYESDAILRDQWTALESEFSGDFDDGRDDDDDDDDDAEGGAL